MTRLAVLAGFGHTVSTPPASILWTDITQYVDVANSGVTIGRGASDEIADIEASTCGLALDNLDGRFTPGRAASPYFPNVRKNTPLRVAVISAVKNLLVNPGFESGVSAWVSSGTPSRATSATHVQDGAQAMLITWGAVASQTMTSPTVYGLDIGQRYTFSAYVWVPAGAAPVRLTVADVTTGAQNTVFDAFQRLTISWTATSTSHQVRVGAIGTPAAGDLAWIDACQIEEGSAATAYDSNGARQHERFWGMVNEWPVDWSGLLSTVTVTATDLFKRLSTQPALRSMLAEEILADGARAYYPLNEGAGTTSAGDLSASGVAALARLQSGSGGTLEFSEGSAPPETGDSAPLFTPASATAGKYLRAELGPAFTTAAAAGADLIIEAWFATSTQGRNIVTVHDPYDGNYLILYLQAGTGYLAVESRDATVTSPVTTIVGGSNLADGEQHHVLFNTETKAVYLDGSPIGIYSAIVTAVDAVRLVVGASHNGLNLWSGSISHVALYANHALSTSQLADHREAGMSGYAGESASARISRLARYAGVGSVTTIGAAFDLVASQGAGGATALEQMRTIARTESAQLFADKDSYGLTLMSRDVRYNPTPEYTIAYADLLTDQVRLSDDDQKLVNIVVASRTGGATQRVINQASIDAYGPKERPLDLLKMSDNSVLDAANWIISRYADPPPELREVPVEAYSLGPSAYRSLLFLGLSGVVQITGLPDQATASEQTVYIDGYTETIKRGEHLMSWHVSRSFNDAVWVLDDPTYSVLGTTTRLAY